MLKYVIAYAHGSSSSLSQSPGPAALALLSIFAHAVVDKIKTDASSLTGRGIIVFKSILTSYLPSIQEHFSPSLDQLQYSTDRRRTLAILENLEKLFQWPSCVERVHVNYFDPSHYPKLTELLLKGNSAQRELQIFATALATKNQSASALWKQLVDSLEDFFEPEIEERGPDLSELQEWDVANEDPDDNQAFVLNLHKALWEHFLFNCQYEWESVITNLRLNWWSKEELAGTYAVCFSLFFLGDQRPENWNAACQWQDTQISVFKLNKVILVEPQEVDVAEAEKGTLVLLPSGASENSKDCDETVSSCSEDDDGDEFWELLGVPTQSQLKFAYAASFKYRGPSQAIRPSLRNYPSVSLTKLLGSEKFNDKPKLLLSFLLVRTLWQYYESDWMGEDWSKDSVHFMFNEHDGVSKVISVNEPFLQTRFNIVDQSNEIESTSKPTTVRSSKKQHKKHLKHQAKLRTHPYPKVLALGIMLLEIELGQRIENFGGRECNDSDEVNVLHNIGVKVLRNEKVWPPKGIYTAVKRAIEICIKPDLEVLGTNKKLLRGNFFHAVVGPLKAMVAGAWPNADTQEMNPIVFEDTDFSPSPVAGELSIHNTKTNNSGYAINPPAPPPSNSALNIGKPSVAIAGNVMATDSPITVDQWFENLDDFDYALKISKSRRNENCQPIKVAILDTGVLESYYQADQMFQKSIKNYKDFVSDDLTTRRENTGHGTNCIQLLQKVYADAEIYVGRVFQGSQATDNTHKLMAAAIKHAVDVWKVKVICMPSGFTTASQEIDDAISTAIYARTLVFAAASNLSNFTSIAFPARLFQTFRLFCMFSTIAGAKPTCYFNPAAHKKARYNFAILGEGIQVPPIHNGAIQNPLSGTSFSTIVAAGVAAKIIDFSSHPDVRGKIDDVDALCQVEGMSEVFAQMVSAVDNSYHCLTPWKLLRGWRPEDAEEEEMRLAGCKTISNALTTRYDPRL